MRHAFTPDNHTTSSRAERRRQLRLDRKIQRRLDQLVADDENAGIGSSDDAAFFERHPERNFRMRLATANEIATTELLGGATSQIDDQRFDWMVIKQIATGVRMRMGVRAAVPLAFTGDEIPEEVARAVYEQFTSPTE